MKKLKYSFSLLLIVAAMAGCSKVTNDDISFIKTAAAPSDGTTKFLITNDNSGMVTITPNGAGASSYDIFFGDATATPTNVQAGKNTTHKYAEGTYQVKVVGKGLTGLTTETTTPLAVTFRAPEDVAVNTSQDAHKLTVSASALYATGGFKVYFGDVANEVPSALASGAELSHTYAEAGKYTVKVVALSGGKATKEVTKEITIYNALQLPMTFEDPNVLYNWGDFGGSATSVIANPYKTGINTSANVGKIVKNRDQTWAGNYIVLSEALDLSVKHTFKVKIYSPRVGMKISLQLERTGDNKFQDHREVATKVANQWEELTFDFTGVDNSKRLQNLLFFIDNGTLGDGTNNYTILFDDIILN